VRVSQQMRNVLGARSNTGTSWVNQFIFMVMMFVWTHDIYVTVTSQTRLDKLIVSIILG